MFFRNAGEKNLSILFIRQIETLQNCHKIVQLLLWMNPYCEFGAADKAVDTTI